MTIKADCKYKSEEIVNIISIHNLHRTAFFYDPQFLKCKEIIIVHLPKQMSMKHTVCLTCFEAEPRSRRHRQFKINLMGVDI